MDPIDRLLKWWREPTAPADHVFVPELLSEGSDGEEACEFIAAAVRRRAALMLS